MNAKKNSKYKIGDRVTADIQSMKDNLAVDDDSLKAILFDEIDDWDNELNHIHEITNVYIKNAYTERQYFRYELDKNYVCKEDEIDLMKEESNG